MASSSFPRATQGQKKNEVLKDAMIAIAAGAAKSTSVAKDVSQLISESTLGVENGKKLVQSNFEIFRDILKYFETSARG